MPILRPDDEWLDMEDKYAEEVEGMLSQNEADSQVIKEVMMAYPRTGHVP